MRSDKVDGLPFVRREIAIGGRTWVIETVHDQDALLAASEGRAHFPFGLMLWESAVALAGELFARSAECAGQRVLELGAGLGLAGVVAASLGAQVVQTDHDATALFACARTAQLNGVDGACQAIGDWHAWSNEALYDLIIGADVAYDGECHRALLAIFERNLARGGTVLLADPGREKQAAFVAMMDASGWHLQRTVRRVDDLAPATARAQIDVAILVLRRT